ncbi:pseudouridine synthase [Fusobacterium sp.]|uniref:pseudouridine synthase n=1 Tax=Fusobacterium TaxID=848 RepID=UPI0025C5287D|nr:pseudouridine synthase [Fusobacterium sp.]MCI5724569.1 rRNA pseudouridine synthase [Fusobacterium sp.]MDD7391341.1 pseudouridine synthase [Fusobacteriaceae bacterium]MDY5795551.1 pseudouridine synthase [Fusobacterium gastrosuis]
MRLDKFLVECGLGSRKEVKEIISNGKITVNGEVTIVNKQNIDEASDEIRFQDEILTYKKYRYYIMNKKAGYITATEDFKERTVMELLPDWVIKKDLAPVGRLDKDTEGLLLFTNDGKLNHKLLSPKSHVDKAYYVEVENDLRTEDLISLENGVTIDDYFTMPAQAKKIEDKKLLLTIREGKFHQVKKMLEAVGNKVLYLKRISFGKLKLNNLELGEVKEVSLEDIV